MQNANTIKKLALAALIILAIHTNDGLQGRTNYDGRRPTTAQEAI